MFFVSESGVSEWATIRNYNIDSRCHYALYLLLSEGVSSRLDDGPNLHVSVHLYAFC